MNTSNLKRQGDTILIVPPKVSIIVYITVCFGLIPIGIMCAEMFGLIISLIFCIIVNYSLLCVFATYELSKEGVKYILFFKKKFISWDSYNTIRYEINRRFIIKHETVYFSIKKSKKPKWLQPNFIHFINEKTFNIELVDKQYYEENDLMNTGVMPKYELLDQLMEWGVNVEIDEKYIEQDPTLRKYISNTFNHYLHQQERIDNHEEELILKQKWIIENNNTHVIEVKKDNYYYHIFVDEYFIDKVERRQVKDNGIEKEIILDNEKYIIVGDGTHFGIAHNNKYIHNGKKYIPIKQQKIETIILCISFITYFIAVGIDSYPSFIVESKHLVIFIPIILYMVYIGSHLNNIN